MIDAEWQKLVVALESENWFWKDGFLYAPNKTIWLSDPWPCDLLDMFKRMQGRLERIRKNRRWVPEQQFGQIETDTVSLIDTLQRLVA